MPLLNHETDSVRNAIYCHMPCYNGQPQSKQVWQTPYSAITQSRYKLIYSYETHEAELYDLENDPGESINIATSYPEVARSLKTDLENWLRDNQAPLPSPKENSR